jgi:hypothetical protein
MTNTEIAKTAEYRRYRLKAVPLVDAVARVRSSMAFRAAAREEAEKAAA